MIRVEWQDVGPWHKVAPGASGAAAVRLEAACREQRATQLLLRCPQPLAGCQVRVAGAAAAAADWQVYRVDCVGTREQGPQPDPLLPLHSAIDLPAGDTVFWLSARTGTRPGDHAGTVELVADGATVASLPLTLSVDPVLLPEPASFSFYLDLWQQPTAVADELGVPRWSDAHLHALRPYLCELARLGQKPITCTIVDEPWGHQTEPDFPSMVGWPARGGTTWDYSTLRRYVELARDCGLRGPVSCYSLVLGPGPRTDCVLPYADGPVSCQVGDPTYTAAWTAFLRDFAAFCRRQGWRDVQIGFDEKPAEVMEPAIALVRHVAPELKIGLAGNWMPEYDATIDDYCILFPGAPPEAAAARAARGARTTFYTCCGPAYPNTFVFSPPLEATLLGWHAAARRHAGYLRWAYQSWPRAAMACADFGPWPAGDCFLVYRGADGPERTQRWEMLLEGIQDYELVAMARKVAEGSAADAEAVESAVAAAASEPDGRRADPAAIVAARRTLRQTVVRLADGGLAP